MFFIHLHAFGLVEVSEHPSFGRGAAGALMSTRTAETVVLIIFEMLAQFLFLVCAIAALSHRASCLCGSSSSIK